MKRREDIEVLAPAGSYESLMAAAQGGADAVYFGIDQLNMRARSSANFQSDDLPRIVDMARERHMKTYLTLNTVIYNEELEQMKGIVDLAVSRGVDALIVSDQAALQYAREAGARIHLSTQLNISNSSSLAFYAGYADVAVLARELNLDQVARIAADIRDQNILGPSGSAVRLEMFVHGALCMAISGKCYLSLHEHNHSANRGDCFQVCRRGYTVTDKDREVELDVENEYIMSPKDLKTIHFLDKILDAGVQVLKIEGRARSGEYVRTVTECYREAVEAWIDGSFHREKVDEWDRRLARVFNRGFWDGYYLGQRLGEWSEVHGSQATRRKEYLGRCRNYYDRIGVMELPIETGSLSAGDEVVILGSTTGAVETRIDELWVEERVVATAGKGEVCTFRPGQPVRRSDKVYKLVPRD